MRFIDISTRAHSRTAQPFHPLEFEFSAFDQMVDGALNATRTRSCHGH
jgi:hypothetical protein